MGPWLRREVRFNVEWLFLLLAVPLFFAYSARILPLSHYNHGMERTLHVVEYAMALRGDPGRMPASFIALSAQAAPGIFERRYGDQKVAWEQALSRLPPSTDNTILPLSLHITVPFKTTSGAANYSVIGYLPFIPAASLGLMLELPPVVIMNMMIASGALVALIMGYFTLKIAPIFKPQLLLLMLLPSASVNRALVIPDTFVMHLCFLMLALVLHYREFPQRLNRAGRLGLLALSLLTGLAKAAYFLVPALAFLIPGQRRGFAAACVALSVTGAVAWDAFVAVHYYDINSSPALAAMLAAPFSFVSELLQSLASLEYLKHWAANLTLWNGYLWTARNWVYNPAYETLALGGVLLLTATAFIPCPWRPSPRERALCLGIFAATGLIVAVMIYAMFYQHMKPDVPFAVTPENSTYIQGRFFLPVLPLLWLAVYYPVVLPKRLKYVIPLTLILLVSAMLAKMHLLMLRSFI